ncbi:MAG: hypothetical protein JWO67_2074 [Streptosporangiaceae bacterium]|nr:hypothetical protein [Streptosporangiaceae bacterium]
MTEPINPSAAGDDTPGRPAPKIFQRFAAEVVRKHDEHLLDYDADEQTDRAAKRLTHFHKTTPLIPVVNTVIGLAGFGEVDSRLTSAWDQYVLLSDTAEALGMPLHKACDWAELQHGYALRDQRDADEERGDGRLGYECLRGYVDLGLSLVLDDPEAKPDASGRRWSFAGDWLISHDRLPALLSVSPWGKEFMDNSMDAWSHAARRLFGDKLRDAPTYGPDGTPTGGDAYTDLFRTELSEEEALRKARRGPAFDAEDQGQL